MIQKISLKTIGILFRFQSILCTCGSIKEWNKVNIMYNGFYRNNFEIFRTFKDPHVCILISPG